MAILGPESSPERDEILTLLVRLANMALRDKSHVRVDDIVINKSGKLGLDIRTPAVVVLSQLPNGQVVELANKELVLRTLDAIRRQLILEELSSL